MKNSFIIGGIVFLLILIFGIYFFTRGDKSENLVAIKKTLQSDLTATQDKLNKEVKTLDTMTNDLQNAFPLATIVQDQMKKASGVVKQTDFMFKNADGLNPEFIVKNFSTSILINNERKNINLLLASWQKKTDISSIQEINADQADQIKKDAQTIKNYIENLSKIVQNLTPANSGLSQFQINIYLSQLPPVQTINDVLTSLGTAIENNNSQNPDTPNNTGTQNNQTSVNSVLPNDIIAQEAIIAQTQAEVASLQDQLNQVEEQIQQSNPTPSTSSPTSTTPATSATIPTNTTTPINTINPETVNQTENQNTNNVNNNNTLIIRKQ